MTGSQGRAPAPKTTPSCSSRTMPFSMKILLTTGSHQNINNAHIHHTPNTMALPGWVEQHNLHTITNLSHADSWLSSSWTLPAISLTEGLGLWLEGVEGQQGHTYTPHTTSIRSTTAPGPKLCIAIHVRQIELW